MSVSRYWMFILAILTGNKVYCMSDIVISKAIRVDANTIAAVHFASWQAEFKELLPADVVKKMNVEFCKSFWEKYLQSNDSHTETYVAKIDAKIVGFIAIIFHQIGEGEIDKIYVAPEYQGLKIGSKLVQYAMKKLQKENCRKVIVKVSIQNIKAQKFYEKLGGTYVKDEDIVDYHSIIRVKVYEFDL